MLNYGFFSIHHNNITIFEFTCRLKAWFLFNTFKINMYYVLFLCMCVAIFHAWKLCAVVFNNCSTSATMLSYRYYWLGYGFLRFNQFDWSLSLLKMLSWNCMSKSLQGFSVNLQERISSIFIPHVPKKILALMHLKILATIWLRRQ